AIVANRQMIASTANSLTFIIVPPKDTFYSAYDPDLYRIVYHTHPSGVECLNDSSAQYRASESVSERASSRLLRRKARFRKDTQFHESIRIVLAAFRHGQVPPESFHPASVCKSVPEMRLQHTEPGSTLA